MRSSVLLALVVAAPSLAQPRRPSDPTEPARRATAGAKRLDASEAGRLVARSIAWHGGLERWFAGRALSMRYRYVPLGKRPARDSHQTVDLLASRAYHDMTEPAQGRFVFDGRRAWATFEEPARAGVRFWALTPYYFVALPFVLADPGVKLERSADTAEAAGLPPADVVRVTFDAGVGDAPDDYYVVYLARDDGRLLGTRYVVSYKPFMARAKMKHSPEKLVVYEDVKSVGPLRLAHRHAFYAFPDGKRGENVTVATASELVYGAEFDETRLDMPVGAHLDESLGP